MRRLLVGLVAVGLVCCVSSAGRAAAQQVQVCPQNRTIAITTSAEAERRAELAILHVGYHLFAPDSAHAYAQAAQLSQAIVRALTVGGVAKDAIASESQGTQPTLEYQYQALSADERAQRLFESQQGWTVKTTPDAVARVLAIAVDAGANRSGQVDWALSDDSSLEHEAGSRALAEAQQLARQVAVGLGAKLGKLLYASNQEGFAPAAGIAEMEGMGGAPLAPAMLNLSPPMIKRSAVVSVTFAMEE